MNYSKKLLFVLCVLCCSSSFAGYVIIDGQKTIVEDRGEQTYKFLSIQTISFSTIEKVCKPWMSENGILTHEKKRSSIVVYDYQDIIDKIQNFIKDTDRERVNIRIEVEFDSVRSLKSVDWKRSRSRDREGSITVGGGRRNIPFGMSVEVPVNRSEIGSYNSSQQLMTLSGYPATLWVGENTVRPQLLNEMIGAKTVTYQDGRTVTISEGVNPDLLFVDVGASLMIRPRQLDGGLIEVEVYPEVSFKNTKGGQESIEVESLKTRVIVRAGSRINIGGMVSSKLSSYKSLFGKQLYKKENGRNVLEMYLRATVVNTRR